MTPNSKKRICLSLIVVFIIISFCAINGGLPFLGSVYLISIADKPIANRNADDGQYRQKQPKVSNENIGSPWINTRGFLRSTPSLQQPEKSLILYNISAETRRIVDNSDRALKVNTGHQVGSIEEGNTGDLWKETKTVQSHHIGLEKYYNHPLLTSCEEYDGESTKGAISTLSIEECRELCAKSGTTYATYLSGKCVCANTRKGRKVINLEACNATCWSEDSGCETKTRPHVVSMRTGKKDGGSDWTVWMVISDVNMKVRYRDCVRNKNSQTNCNPHFERKSIDGKAIDYHKREFALGYKYIIGCFTGNSIVSDGNYTVTSLQNVSEKRYLECRSICQRINTIYSIITPFAGGEKGRCYCVNSLKQARPTDSCSGTGVVVLFTNNYKENLREPTKGCPSFGAAVIFTSTNNHGLLKFDGGVQKKGKVLVLARYRSGSSMTQSFFVRNPNPIILFEPGKGKSEAAPSERALLRGLEAFFKCDLSSLPQIFHNSDMLRFSFALLKSRGQRVNSYGAVLDCYHDGLSDCAPIWQEACDRSSFLNVKTIRILSAEAVREFIERNPDVHVVHLVRDPRGLLGAQKVVGTRSPYNQVCDQLVEVGKMVAEMKKKGYKNVHEVFYEQLAVNASFYGAQIYREMNIEMPEEVVEFLKRANDLKYGIPSDARNVVKADPWSSVYSFLKRYKISEIREIDNSCESVYSLWPDHYTDVVALYQRNGMKLKKYVSKQLLDSIKE